MRQSTTSGAQPERAWCRQPYVWLLIVFPALAVCSGLATLVIAHRTFDGMVVDDYYRRGKEINQVLERDRAAAALGLRAALRFDPERGTLEAALRSDSARPLPAVLELQLVYATRAGLDRELRLVRVGHGLWRGDLPGLRAGRWHLQLQAEAWRLTGSMRVPGPREVALRAAAG